MKLKNFDLLGYRAMGWLSNKKELSNFSDYKAAVQIALNVLSELPEEIQADLVRTDFLLVADVKEDKVES